MKNFLFGLILLCLYIKLKTAFVLYLNITENETYHDIGILMGKGKTNESLFVKYQILKVNFTNKICQKIGYDSIHSISLPYKLKKSFSYTLNLQFDNEKCCKLFINKCILYWKKEL